MNILREIYLPENTKGQANANAVFYWSMPYETEPIAAANPEAERSRQCELFVTNDIQKIHLFEWGFWLYIKDSGRVKIHLNPAKKQQQIEQLADLIELKYKNRLKAYDFFATMKAMDFKSKQK